MNLFQSVALVSAFGIRGGRWTSGSQKTYTASRPPNPLHYYTCMEFAFKILLGFAWGIFSPATTIYEGGSEKLLKEPRELNPELQVRSRDTSIHQEIIFDSQN